MRKVKPKWYRSNFVSILAMFAVIGAIQFVVSVAWNWTKNHEVETAYQECLTSAIPDFACVLMRK